VVATTVGKANADHSQKAERPLRTNEPTGIPDDLEQVADWLQSWKPA
jgi:hypothetical protein